MPTHPMQPIVIDEHGIARFKRNRIVCTLLELGPLDLNKISCLPFDEEDRIQLAQLIGYSVSGAGDLSYMPADLIARADEEVEKLIKKGQPS